MSTDSIVCARIYRRIKDEAAVVPERLVPNAETIAAMKAARRGQLTTAGKLGKLLASLHADD
jgi:DNA-damage-inducible protein J